MRQLPQALKDALWNGNLVVKRELVTLYKTDGTVWARWTTAVGDVTYGGKTWSSTAPVITAPSGMSDTGLAADARDVILGGSFTLDGKTLQRHALDGAFEEARFVWEQAISTTGDIVGTLVRFDGVVIDAEPRSASVRLRVKSATSLLEQEVPTRALQLSCPFDFKGTLCGYAGAQTTCDHTFTRCQELSNQARFGGLRLMPRSEASE